MRVLGIDFGEKRIGLAISDGLGITAQPLAVVSNIQGIKQVLAERDDVHKIVVGLPKNLKGEIGPQAQKTLVFVEELKKETGLPVLTWDERFSTGQAEKVLIEAGLSRKKRKSVVDKSAAALILQSYLDAKK
jgi:putative Holliday junction resolvase